MDEQLNQLRAERDIFIFQRNWEKALVVLDEMIAIDETASRYVRRAMLFIKQKKYDIAIKNIQQSLKLEPKHAKANHLLALLQKKIPKTSLSDTKTVIENPHLDTWKTLKIDIDNINCMRTYKGQYFEEEDITTYDINQDKTLIVSNDLVDQNKETLLDEIQEQTFIIDTQISNSIEKISNEYQIKNLINQGGMGLIFTGIQESLHRKIAIKKLNCKQDLSQNFVYKKRFLSEAITTAYLDHPNIVPIYDIKEVENREIILAMKLVRGTSWKKILDGKDDPTYCLEKHLAILLDVCKAISFAHSKGITHNDLKPDNIMVGEFEEILVMDWGIATSVDEQHNKYIVDKSTINFPMGTPHYMPPELANGFGKDICFGTDTYLLGSILYEILMGKPPHTGENSWAIIQSACSGKVPKFNDDIPQELQNICTKALQKEIEKRYETVEEFKSAIQEFLQHRESIIIANDALKIFKHCQQLSQEKTDNFSLYNKYAESVFGFKQALRLWEKNSLAFAKLTEVCVSYAHAALLNKDIGLARSLIVDLDRSSDAVKELEKEIQNIVQAKFSQEKMIKKLRAAVVISITIVIFGLTLGIWKINLSAERTRDVLKELALENANAKKGLTAAMNAIQYANSKVEGLHKDKNFTEPARIVSYHLTSITRQSKSEIYYTNLIKEGVELESSYTKRGQQYFHQGNFVAALNDFNQAISIAPKYIDAYIWRGINYHQGLNDANKAIDSFNKVIVFDPKSSLAYSQRGIVYRSTKDYDKALQDFNKAISLDSESKANDYVVDTSVLDDKGRQYMSRGILYDLTKQKDKALRDFEKGISLSPKNLQIINYYVSYSYRIESSKDIKKSFLEELEKFSSLYLDTLALYYAWKGEKEKAFRYSQNLPRIRKKVELLLSGKTPSEVEKID
ncbi:tetratricopeptide repeat protein [Candidatus Uabimicrobium sp. HlEnr_7]|uniref:protein kinase domain-containing protein n=1 Tax=Candidatus Uabimicrobium helgolandensis TaxID=3095367 RepID=UPI0035582DC0